MLPLCVLSKSMKQAFLRTKKSVFEKITLFLTDLCGFILYSRIKAVTLRQTQQIIEVWRI